KKDPKAVAETITNNIRKVIVDKYAMNPRYYDKMSQLLDTILAERRKGARDHKELLKMLVDHATKLGKGESEKGYPAWADSGARRALVDFFDPSVEQAVEVDVVIRRSKPDSWLGNPIKEKILKRELSQSLPEGFERLDELFELVKARYEYH
ncbi:MAG: restriction endonuclease subunit R, partial [Mycobacteriales bacterium]